MIRGLYTATSGMTLNERMQEIVSNNIANANTVGYKGDTGVIRSFPEELLLRMNDNKSGVGAEKNNMGTIGSVSYGALLEEAIPRFVAGTLKASDNPHARAIVDLPQAEGSGREYARSYFPVLVGNQTMLTRDGDFGVQTGTNLLITSRGNYVLPVNTVTGQPMTDARIRVGQNGAYEYVNAAGQPLQPNAQVNPAQGVVDVADSRQLEKYGETYFRGGQVERGTGQMNQGQLEQSNVDLSASMVTMMNVVRSYEANQRMIRSLDSTLEKAVSVGRLG